MEINQQLKIYDDFRNKYEQLKQQYSISKSPKDLVSGIYRLAENPDYRPFARFLFFLGNSYMESGDFEAGVACMKTVVACFSYMDHYAIFYLRMAQYHIENGNTKAGINYLVWLCTEVADFEAQLAMYNLTEVWEKYKSLVPSEVPELIADEKRKPVASIPIPQPKQPDECSQTIDEILSLPEADLLSGLSTHLGEMTANGAILNCLNKWERNFYYVDEMCMEVNSGGFEGYLYYHGTHFAKVYQVFSQIGAEQMVQLMERIQCKFPRGRVPKSEEAIQNAMDRLEEKGIDFEDEDELYYSSVEKELLDRLSAYVLENRKHFR
ncbi:MAG: DUF4375 domain-containing protein [Oscillospiraceae bacterium]|nr:DUF4375 domain-containing protein [Oscillospiraceae bacterium]